MNKKKRHVLIFLVVLIIIFFSGILAWYYSENIVIVKKQPLFYIVKPGTTVKVLAHDFNKQANLTHPKLFCFLSKYHGADKALKTGEYFFPVGSTIKSVLNTIVKGKVYYRSFTIVNGWNFNRLLQALNKAPDLRHTLTYLTQQKIAAKLNIKQKNLEGLFLPETYFYTRGSTDLQLLQRSQRLLQIKLQQLWQQRDQSLPYKNPYQVLIVASLVEKETGIKHERPIIAAIILKRWQQWMPLQIDAAVIYGLGNSFTGYLTKKDLRKQTPYNTYIHYGLPPTPIAMPGQASISAALHPVQTDALYFVAKGDGTHVFSKTLKGHDQAVTQYQRND